MPAYWEARSQSCSWGHSGYNIGKDLAGWYRGTLRSTKNVGTGPGRRYVQEDNPHLIGRELMKLTDQVILAEEGKT